MNSLFASWISQSVGERWRKLAIIFLTLHHASGSTFFGTKYSNRIECEKKCGKNSWTELVKASDEFVIGSVSQMKKTCHYFSHVTSCIGVNLLWDRVCKSLRIFNEPFFNVYMSRQWICAYKAGYKYKRYCIINNICRSCIIYVLLYIWTYT